MAKIILPCMSIEAHGQIAKGIIFATNKHGQYIKFVRYRPRPATEAQQRVRYAYGQISIGWRALTDEQKATYHTKAVRAGITDYNQYFKEQWPLVYVP